MGSISHTVLPLASHRPSRGSIWGKNKPNLSLPSLSPPAHSPLLDPWNQQDLRFYSRQQTPKPTKYLAIPNATFSDFINLVLFQRQWGSPSCHQMTASPFLDSTCVYCKEKQKILHTWALPVGLSTTCLYFHLYCEATLLKNLFFRCHHR